MKSLSFARIVKPALLIYLLIIILLSAIQVRGHTPAPPQQEPIVLVGGTIHPVNSEPIPNGMVLFENGVITAVGTDLEIPENARVVNISGKHVYPGLIHGRNTMGLSEIGRIAETTDMREKGNINPNVRARVAFHPASEHIPVAAVNGITTVVSTPMGGIISGKADAMITDGWTWEQMTLEPSIGMVIEWPSMREKEARDKALNELYEAFDKAKRYKIAREAMHNNQAPHHPMDVRWEAMIPVLKREMPVFLVANELRQIQAALDWAEKENLKMVLVGARDGAYLAEQIASRGIPVMVAPVIGGPSLQWEGYDQAYSLPAALHKAGVRFCIGGDAGAASAYRLPHHAASAVAFGLPEDVALKAITIYAAEILGLDHRVGSIEPGKDATFIITDGTPLELWTDISQVYIQGREIDMTDKHRRLFERYREKHRQAQME